MVALETALTYPDRVRSLVLAATHAGAARATRDHRAAAVRRDRPYLVMYSEAFAREHPEHVEEDLRVGRRNPQPFHAGRRQWEALQAWDAWDRLGEVRHPALVLHGTEDRMVPMENARRLARGIPGARLVLLEGAGHLYHSEQAEASDSAVLEFLDRVEG
jgi:pimeloyl-ACP methyl ester carboxylesterase